MERPTLDGRPGDSENLCPASWAFGFGCSPGVGHPKNDAVGGREQQGVRTGLGSNAATK